MIYKDRDGYCTRVSGQFFEKENNHYLQKINENKFTYVTTDGDACGDTEKYKVIYNFNNVKGTNTKVKYDNLKVPNKGMTSDCERTIEISVDFEDSTQYLLIQILFNDYWIITGILFLLIGIYLMILSQNAKATKFVISIIFGEIFIFTLGCGIFGLSYKYLEWCLVFVGLVIGGSTGYFCLGKKKRLYRAILAIDAGFISGIILFDLIFCHRNYHMSAIILTDCVLIFITLGLITIYLVPDYHYFYHSIIGSYIFIRGISILMQKLGKYSRYRELQLLLYLLNRYEIYYAKHLYEDQWPVYFIYDILIIIFMGVSMFYYYSKAVGRDEEEGKEEPNQEEKLIGAKRTTSTENDEELE